MGKKSKRRDGPRTRSSVAPATLGPDDARYFEPEFRPIITPPELLETEEAKVLDEALAAGLLVSWELGRKGTHIASRWVSSCGNEDTIVAVKSSDDSYKQLMNAHVQRLIQWAGLGGSTSAAGVQQQ